MKTYLFGLLSLLLCLSCNNKKKETIPPIEIFSEVDAMLENLAEKTQTFTRSSKKKTIITGKSGTIVHVDPKKLETIDGSPLANEIVIELNELNDKSSLLLNNAPTTSNGELLVTGGAYYINMTSGGKQLKIKQGESIEVEFPKMTDDEMILFTGKKDAFGQVNWQATTESFVAKDIARPKKPEKPKSIIEVDTIRQTIIIDRSYDYSSSFDDLAAYLNSKDADIPPKESPAYQKALKEYEKKQKEIAYRLKTYNNISITNLGWINCDRLYRYDTPKVDLPIAVKGETIPTARFYAIFKDINSVSSVSYSKTYKNSPKFNNLPSGMRVKIIGLASVGETPYVFEETITASADQQIDAEFTATTQRKIKALLKRL